MSFFRISTNQGVLPLHLDLMSMYMLYVHPMFLATVHDSSIGFSSPNSASAFLRNLPSPIRLTSSYPLSIKLKLNLCLSLFVLKLRCITLRIPFLSSISFTYFHFENIWANMSIRSTVPVLLMPLGYGKKQ